MFSPTTRLTWRCIHCTRKIDVEKDVYSLKKSFSVPLKYMGEAFLPPNSYRKVTILHCDNCDAIEREMVAFRNKTVIHVPLCASTAWFVVFLSIWVVCPPAVIAGLLPFFIITGGFTTGIAVVLITRPWIKRFLIREDFLALHRLIHKNDYSRLLPLYQLISAVLAAFFPVGIPVLLTASLFYYLQERTEKGDRECLFRRIPQQCKYCSGGTSSRKLKGVLVHYYRHSENCSLFLRGWVDY